MSADYEHATSWPVPGGAPPKGSVAWVVGVGAVAGTGGAVCRRLAKGGMTVVVTGRTEEKINAVVDTIKAEGGKAVAALGDSRSDEGLADALRIVKETGDLRVTIYNAGGSQWKQGTHEMDTAFVEDVWRINCLGGFICARESSKIMLERGDGGAILFTGSISGVIARPKLAAYAMAKFGQRAAAQALARELGPKNIHVANVIVHGPIDGDRLHTQFPHAKDKRPVDGIVSIDAIAETFWQVIVQPRTAWTQEMDIRPYIEPF